MDNKDGILGKVGAGVIGAVAGATAVSLMHKPTRKKVKNKINEFLDTADEKLDDAGDRMQEAKQKTKRTLARKMNEAESRLNK